MNKEQSEDYIKYLERTIEKIKSGEVEWAALSVKFKDGGSMAVHSKTAPKRPRGVS